MPLSDRFYRAAYYMLESQQDAEDAVQELYLRIWKSHANLTDLKSPVAYGMSLLKNICIDRIRRRSARQTEPLEKAPPVEDGPSQNPIEARDTLRFLLNEMEKLPQKQPNIFTALKLLQNAAKMLTKVLKKHFPLSAKSLNIPKEPRAQNSISTPTNPEKLSPKLLLSELFLQLRLKI